MICNQLVRSTLLVGILALIGGLGGAGILMADDDREDREDRRDRDDSEDRPPQTLRQGFESKAQLLRDVERAERGPEYSAWIVESSRFLNVPFGAFQPDKAGLNTTVDLPVNVGIIKGF
jgi:hypothetical protein